jgi:hypothetical protein
MLVARASTASKIDSVGRLGAGFVDDHQYVSSNLGHPEPDGHRRAEGQFGEGHRRRRRYPLYFYSHLFLRGAEPLRKSVRQDEDEFADPDLCHACDGETSRGVSCKLAA